MAPVPVSRRVAKFKVKNPQKVKLNKVKEHAEIAKKRVNDKDFDEEFKRKERERKRLQRAKKKVLKSGQPVPPPPTDSVPHSVSFGDSFLPLPFESSFNDMEVSEDHSTIMSPLFSSTPAPVKEKFKVRIPFKDKTNQSRQSKQGLLIRKQNNLVKNDELKEMKNLLNKSEEENIAKDFEIAELYKKINDLENKNSSLESKLKGADDWLIKTYKYLTPLGRNELKMGAFLAKDEFESGVLRRIRENTGINFSKSPTLFNDESSDLKKAIHDFAFENSSDVPDMKAAKKGIRYFYSYKTVIWIQFVSSSGFNVSYSQFCRYWPETIIKPKIEDFGSCKCIPCENTELLLNAMKRQNLISKEHQLDIMIKDVRFGDKELEDKFIEELELLEKEKEKSLTYLHWEGVQKENGKRELIHRVQKTKSCPDAVGLMKSLYESLKLHLERNFIMKKTIKERRETVLKSSDQAYIHMDWAENLEIKIPGEVQSAFFSHTSVSLHTGYVYSNEDSGGFVSLSDDGCHKAEAIHAALKPVIDKLVDRGIKHIVCVSDSPTSQYRNNKNMWLTKEIAKNKNISIEWLFTEAGHGKSVCDGIGGTVKNLLRDLTAYNTSLAISNAKDVMDLISPHTSIDLFWYNKSDIDDVLKNLPSLSSLTGATKIHQVQFDNLGNMMAKSLPTDPVSQRIQLKILRNKNNV